MDRLRQNQVQLKLRRSMNLAIQIKVLPNSPGVYQYFDKDNTIIYVGKAKNLKKRVSSYFNKQHDSGKTRVLVKKIHKIEFIVVETETDALLLENNLIKKLTYLSAILSMYFFAGHFRSGLSY